MVGRPLIGGGLLACTLYPPTLNGGKASDWLRPVPCQREGDKLPKGTYQSSNGYSTRVHLPGHLACNPSSRREASHVSSQGKEAVFVTHDIYYCHLFFLTSFNRGQGGGRILGPPESATVVILFLKNYRIVHSDIGLEMLHSFNIHSDTHAVTFTTHNYFQ